MAESKLQVLRIRRYCNKLSEIRKRSGTSHARDAGLKILSDGRTDGKCGSNETSGIGALEKALECAKPAQIVTE